MKPIPGRLVVTVRRSLRGDATILLVDSLPAVPDGATHTWPAEPFTVDVDHDPHLWFTLPFTPASAGQPLDALRANVAGVAHRLAAEAGYTGHLDLYRLPMFDLSTSVCVIPTEPLSEACG